MTEGISAFLTSHTFRVLYCIICLDILVKYWQLALPNDALICIKESISQKEKTKICEWFLVHVYHLNKKVCCVYHS